MSFSDNKITQKFIFILKSSNKDNKWDTWENANTDNDNLLLINTKNWHISFTDFINNDLDMGADGINIIEIVHPRNPICPDKYVPKGSSSNRRNKSNDENTKGVHSFFQIFV